MAKKESPDKDTDTTTDTKAAANESVLDAETVNARAKNVSVDPSDAIKKASDRIQKAKQDLAVAHLGAKLPRTYCFFMVPAQDQLLAFPLVDCRDVFAGKTFEVNALLSCFGDHLVWFVANT